MHSYAIPVNHAIFHFQKEKEIVFMENFSNLDFNNLYNTCSKKLVMIKFDRKNL